MGATASKKLRRWSPVRPATASARAPSVSGPEATSTGALSSRAVTSSRCTVIFGCFSTISVTAAEKTSRSTASAPPAATRAVSAAFSRWLPIIFISSLSRPEAESGRSAFSELEQISSAKPALLWAGENLPGFCSYRSTCTPASASHSAASHPARPAPITFTCIVTPLWFRRYSAIFYFFSIGFVKPQPSLAQ